MEKAVVILSGGVDSAVVLAQVVATYGPENVEALTFNYGSKHNTQENRRAKSLAKHYGVRNFLIRMPFVNRFFASDLLQSGGEVPEGHYADPSMKRTVVPFRNGIMLSIAAGFAESRGAKYLFLGAHAGDHAIYPDCRPEWTRAMAAAIRLGGYGEVVLRVPFEDVSKTEVCRLGGALRVPYELTYSCYRGDENHCGKCSACFERKEAFLDSGTPDPTIYADGK